MVGAPDKLPIAVHRRGSRKMAFDSQRHLDV